MKRFTTTLSDLTIKRIEELRKKHGFSSSNQVIEHLVMEDSISKRIDILIETIDRHFNGASVHKMVIPDKKWEELGFCAKYCSKEKQRVFKTIYTTPDDAVIEEYLCQKHLNELKQYVEVHGGTLA